MGNIRANSVQGAARSWRMFNPSTGRQRQADLTGLEETLWPVPGSLPYSEQSPQSLSFPSTNGALFSRNLTEILLNSQHLECFREFLRERKAENPLLFLIAVQKIMMETNEKTYKTALENITKTYFHGKFPPGTSFPPDSRFSFLGGKVWEIAWLHSNLKRAEQGSPSMGAILRL